jgi:hypothetical protein
MSANPIDEAVVLAAKRAAYAADPDTVLTEAATRAVLTAAQQQWQATASVPLTTEHEEHKS